MHDVFISYSHVDAQVADAICHHLEEAGIRCWYAPRNIEPGVEWADAIIDAIEACSVMVLVFTDFSNDSRQVRREVDAAINGGKAIIPFKYTKSEPTGSMRYYLSTLHWLDAVDEPLETSIEELRGRIEGLLGSGDSASLQDGAVARPAAPATATAGQGGASSSKPSRKTLLLAGIAALALVFVVGMALLNGGNKAADTSTDMTKGAETATAADASDEAAQASDDTEPSATTDEAAQPEEDAITVTPAPGDEDAVDNYLYTIQYDNTVRLDRYMGPETAKLVIPTTVEGLRVECIGEKCFEDVEWIEELVLPEGIEIIQYRAFYGCSNLKKMNIPSTLHKILGWAFAHSGLVNMDFPDTFTDLDYGAFYGCTELESVVLPPAVDYLGENTFRWCDKLKSVTIAAPEPEINAKAFEPNTDVTIIGVAGSYTEKYAKGMGLAFQAL